MKIVLKDFQEEAVTDLLIRLKQAKAGLREGIRQALVLTSPTGSGKTVIITAFIERILEGDASFAMEPDAVFLWLSDQPELNEQSRNKLASTSSRLRQADLVVVDAFFDQETFDDGKVFFLNTQKLGKDKQLVSTGNERQFTIWETIKNTAVIKKNRFYVVIDEAHRGTRMTSQDETAKKTIIKKFILGDPGVLPPMDLIIGMSATPENFVNLLQNTQGAIHLKKIPPIAVRASGLLKDVISLFKPDTNYPTDWTMLAAAAKHWKKLRDSWQKYTVSQGIPDVHPALIVQVEDGTNGVLTKTDLSVLVKTLEKELGSLREEEIAHSFQEDHAIEAGGLRIRKIEASRIQNETRIKVILFKMALTTGWDCPRAEVMMSFRRAQDHTLIAQLIGRMVRTPLARRVEGQDLLNSVALFLPHYDKDGINLVISHLESDDPDATPLSEIRDGNEEILLNRREDMADAFKALEGRPTYRIERVRALSNTRRLMRLSRLLTVLHAIDPHALEESKKMIIDIITEERERLLHEDPLFEKQVDNIIDVVLNSIDLDQRTWSKTEGEGYIVQLSDMNINDLFHRAGLRLGEGLNTEYWKAKYDQNDPDRPKVELYLLLQNERVWVRLEMMCSERITLLFEKHKFAIQKRTSSEKEEYNKIRELAKDPEVMMFSAPSQITIPGDKKSEQEQYSKHLYLDDEGLFKAKFTSWEKETISAEINREDILGWLRNYDRKPWSLCVPYDQDGTTQSMYPDFLVVRKVRIPAYPDGESGNIRTAFRQHPDTCRAVSF